MMKKKFVTVSQIVLLFPKFVVKFPDSKRNARPGLHILEVCQHDIVVCLALTLY